MKNIASTEIRPICRNSEILWSNDSPSVSIRPGSIVLYLALDSLKVFTSIGTRRDNDQCATSGPQMHLTSAQFRIFNSSSHVQQLQAVAEVFPKYWLFLWCLRSSIAREHFWLIDIQRYKCPRIALKRANCIICNALRSQLISALVVLPQTCLMISAKRQFAFSVWWFISEATCGEMYSK